MQFQYTGKSNIPLFATLSENVAYHRRPVNRPQVGIVLAVHRLRQHDLFSLCLIMFIAPTHAIGSLTFSASSMPCRSAISVISRKKEFLASIHHCPPNAYKALPTLAAKPRCHADAVSGTAFAASRTCHRAAAAYLL